MFNRLNFLILISTLLITLPGLSREKDRDIWPQFRGQHRDGISHSKNLMSEWPAEGPKQRWKVSIGSGFSGITIDGKRLFTMFAEDSSEFLGCFDRSSGALRWKMKVGEMFIDEFGNGPRSTPAIDKKSVYALSSNGELYAFDKKKGKQRWKVSFPELYDSGIPQRGFSMSPIVYNDLVVCETGGIFKPQQENRVLTNHISAFNKKTGKEVWRKKFDPGVAGYSSGILATIYGQEQFVFTTFGQLLGISEGGEELWNKKTHRGVIAMPVAAGDNRFFVSSAGAGGCMMMTVNNSGDSLAADTLWNNRYMKNHFNSSVYHNGYIYGFSNATLTCLDAATGELRWRKRGYGKGAIIGTRNNLIVITDKGLAVLLEATPEACNEISSFQAIDGKSWTSPTLVDGKLYLRNHTEMACYDIGK